MSIAICYCLFWAVCALWLTEAITTTTHTPGDTANHWLFTPSYLVCMCISARQNMSSNQICMYTTYKSCPIVGEPASSLMEGNDDQDHRRWILKSFGEFYQIKKHLGSCSFMQHSRHWLPSCQTLPWPKSPGPCGVPQIDAYADPPTETSVPKNRLGTLWPKTFYESSALCDIPS